MSRLETRIKEAVLCASVRVIKTLTRIERKNTPKDRNYGYLL